MIICRTCHVERSEESFHIRHDTGKRRSECKICRTKARKLWNAENPEVQRKAKRAHYERYKPQQRLRSQAWAASNRDRVAASALKRKYGLTAKEYADMLAAQSGVCAICSQPETVVSDKNGKLRKLHVDHNHATGAVRSLLCTRCNMAIGYLGESADRADAVAIYIRKHEKTAASGTADMVRKARAAGIPVREVTPAHGDGAGGITEEAAP